MTAADHRLRRVLRVAGAVTAAAVVVCGGIAAAMAADGDGREVAPGTVTIPSPPSTVAPRSTTSSTTTTTTLVTTTTGAPLSALSALVGETVSAVPVAPTPDIPPVELAIPDLGISGVPVRAVGVTPEGELEIPGAEEAGWYRFGAAPGQPGATVVAAHVSWQGRTGPFFRLADLQPGAFVDVVLADQTTRRYQVIERAQYDKRQLPPEQVWRTSGPESLVLITCGGAFNPQIRRYADNIVVTAVPVA